MPVDWPFGKREESPPPTLRTDEFLEFGTLSIPDLCSELHRRHAPLAGEKELRWIRKNVDAPESQFFKQDMEFYFFRNEYLADVLSWDGKAFTVETLTLSGMSAPKAPWRTAGGKPRKVVLRMK